MSKFILLILLVSLVLVSPVLFAASETDQSCFSCHSLEYAQWRLSPHNIAQKAVSCTTCHHEHNGDGPAGLRLARSELCASCHADDPQYRLLVGTGQSAHNTEGSCLTCHMAVTPGRITVGGHTVLMQDTSGRKNVAACTPCHEEVWDFNLNNRQQEIAERLTWLQQHLPPEDSWALEVYRFIKEDGSLGVHNPEYAVKLLIEATASVGAPEWISRPAAELPQEDDICLTCKW